MIQIQDDFVSQSQTPPPVLSDMPTQSAQPTPNTTAPVMPTVDAVPSQNDQLNQAVQQTMQKVEENTKNNAAEIDRLLAELDELSKNLESQAVAPSVEDAKPAESSQTVTSLEPAPTSEPTMASEPEPALDLTSAKTETNPDSEEEKFDFDAFLDDLEKKIDEESAKIKAAKSEAGDSEVITPIDPAPVPKSVDAIAADEPVDDIPDDFRKNRVPNLSTDQVEDEKADLVESEALDAAPVTKEPSSASTEESEELRAQNIFEMLGLADISNEEKNQFLDELESMIWDDFIVHDLELLLTSEEYAKAREILDSSSDENQKKEDLIVYLEKIVPDLDEVLYEKALELKSEMMGERLSKMKEGADEATLAKVKQAESLISQNLWRQAATLLNG